MSLRQLIFKFPSIQTTARGNVSQTHFYDGLSCEIIILYPDGKNLKCRLDSKLKTSSPEMKTMFFLRR